MDHALENPLDVVQSFPGGGVGEWGRGGAYQKDGDSTAAGGEVAGGDETLSGRAHPREGGGVGGREEVGFDCMWKDEGGRLWGEGGGRMEQGGAGRLSSPPPPGLESEMWEQGTGPPPPPGFAVPQFESAHLGAWDFSGAMPRMLRRSFVFLLFLPGYPPFFFAGKKKRMLRRSFFFSLHRIAVLALPVVDIRALGGLQKLITFWGDLTLTRGSIFLHRTLGFPFFSSVKKQVGFLFFAL
jgi:hypothetical protein